MININPSFFHDLFKVAIRNAIPDIKENRIKNNVFGKVYPFKADHDFILCTLGNKGELSQNLPGGATESPQLTYTCDRTQ
jgi:hypothetical protein